MTTPTGILFGDPQVKPLSTTGQPQAAAYLYFYLTGTTAQTDVYADGELTTPLSQPVTADSAGRFVPIYLNPATIYRVQLYNAGGSKLEDTDPYVPVPQVIPTQVQVGAVLYPENAAETAASATIVQPWFPYGYVDRYGANTSPGVTDMSLPFQTAISVAQAAVLLGQSGIPVTFLAAAYLINTPPTIASNASNLMVPVTIGGAGLGTILYCGLTGTGGFISIFSGCYLHDFQIVSALGTTNNGILVITTGGSQPIGFLIERVYSRMQGIGFLLANCNSGTIRNCWHWNDKAPALPIAISAAGSNVGHGIYLTGASPGTGFVNDVSIYDFQGVTSQNYASGQRWIKGDALNMGNIRIRGGLITNESSGVAQKMLELGSAAGGSHVNCAEVIGVNHQGGYLEFNNMTCSVVGACFDGGQSDYTGVGLNFQLSSVANLVMPCDEAGTYGSGTGNSLQFDSSSGSNTIIGGNYRTLGPGSGDSATAPNTYLTANRSASFGGTIDNTLAYSASMTPNVLAGKRIRVVVTNNSNWTLNNPTNLNVGDLIQVAIINDTGSTIGVGTFGSMYKLASSTPTMPGTMKQRCWLLAYDGTNLTVVGNEPTADTGF